MFEFETYVLDHDSAISTGCHSVDFDKYTAIFGLAWIDVINSAVWLLVVLVLEADVRLQEHNLYEGLMLLISGVMKVFLYTALLYAAIYWGMKGDFVGFWDAFL